MSLGNSVTWTDSFKTSFQNSWKKDA